MTRSRRHTPILANTCAESDKRDKVAAHRIERRAVRIAVSREDEPPAPKTFGNPWSAAKDGKNYVTDPEPEWMRK